MQMSTRYILTITITATILLLSNRIHPVFAAEVGFSHLWGGYSTSLKLRSSEQRHNIATAAGELNGSVIEPGGILSFNRKVGGRDRAKGYQAAPFITASGQMLDTPGGGICQLASTIYNAALLAGMEILERHPHSRTVGHIPPGRDATISSWRKDLKFRNRHPVPLQLRITVDNNRITSSLYGASPKGFSTEIRVNRTPLLPETVVLERGKGVSPQPGVTGFSTETVRITTENGGSYTELISRDTYPAPSRIINR